MDVVVTIVAPCTASPSRKPAAAGGGRRKGQEETSYGHGELHFLKVMRRGLTEDATGKKEGVRQMLVWVDLAVGILATTMSVVHTVNGTHIEP